MSTVKNLPSNVDAERCVLGAMLIRNGESIGDIQGQLMPEEFFVEAHRLIYETMLEVYADQKTIDLTLLIDRLEKKNLLDKVGGTRFILYLGNNIQTNANIKSHAGLVKEKYRLRQLIAIGEELADDAYANREEVKDIVAVAEQRLLSLNEQEEAVGSEHISEIILRVHHRVNTIYSSGSPTTGLETKFPTFDKLTGGLQKSDFIIIAARPSMGKTALAINIANNVARIITDPTDRRITKEGRGTVALFSLEMSKEQIGNRLLSLESGVNSQRLNNGQLEDSEWTDIQEASARIARAKLYVDDTPGITATELRTRARRLKNEHGLDLVVVDYLQLMSGGIRQTRETNRQQEISEISRSMKALARELDVPVIALSQLSRAVELRAEKKPQLSDLRESGSLEQDADIVIFLYRESYYKPDAADDSTEMIVAKHRNGPTGVLNLRFQKDTMMFQENSNLAQS